MNKGKPIFLGSIENVWRKNVTMIIRKVVIDADNGGDDDGDDDDDDDDDDDGDRNRKQRQTTTSVTKKMNLRPFKLYRVYLEPLNSSNVGDFFLV